MQQCTAYDLWLQGSAAASNRHVFGSRYALKAPRGVTASSCQETLLPLKLRVSLNSRFQRVETSVEAKWRRLWFSIDVSQRMTHGKHKSSHTRSSGGLDSLCDACYLICTLAYGGEAER